MINKNTQIIISVHGVRPQQKAVWSFTQGLLVSSETIEHFDRFELIIDDIINCFPKYKDGNVHVINNLKQRLGKMLSNQGKIHECSSRCSEEAKRTLQFNWINVLLCIILG